ncbi:MAG: lipoprotein [Pseudolabrys sp.]
MASFRDRPFLRLALIGVLAATLGLAACGRKGPLDPPPGASLAGEAQASSPGPIASPIGGETKSGNSGIGPDGKPLLPPGPNKRIPLDVLLN